jgi:hypothetical protein
MGTTNTAADAALDPVSIKAAAALNMLGVRVQYLSIHRAGFVARTSSREALERRMAQAGFTNIRSKPAGEGERAKWPGCTYTVRGDA